MRASPRIRSGLPAAALAVALAGAGCDWRDFDTLAGQTPVMKVTAPGGFQSTSDFASLILPMAPPVDGSVPAWFLTSAVESLGVALVKVGANGGQAVQNLQSATFDNLGTSNPLTALAEIPGTGTAFLGAPTAPPGTNLVTVNLATQEANPFLVSAGTGSELQLGAGVAAGNLAGTATPDLAAISTSRVHLFVDGMTDALHDASPADITACPIVLGNVPSSERAHRAVVAGALLASGPAVAVGVPGAAASGTVVFYTVSGDATVGFSLTCAGILSAPTAGVADAGFGAALAIGDVDGDGLPDLLVGAPPNAVYLYKGPLTLPAVPTATVRKPANSAAFGASVATLNLDGKPGEELLVGDPGVTLGGVTGAGNVTVYSGATLAPVLAPPPSTTSLVLADHNPGTGEGYGAAVAGLPFCAVAPCTAATVTPLPLVGAPGAAFTYFTLGPVDPRVK
jgi:hypothetical protein